MSYFAHSAGTVTRPISIDPGSTSSEECSTAYPPPTSNFSPQRYLTDTWDVDGERLLVNDRGSLREHVGVAARPEATADNLKRSAAQRIVPAGLAPRY